MSILRAVLCAVFAAALTIPASAQNKKFDKALRKIDGYYSSGELEKAASSLKKLKSSVRSKMGATNTYMPEVAMREARINLTLGLVMDFDKQVEVALTESKNIYGENSNSYAQALLQVAEMYNEYGNFRIARQYIENSKAILTKTSEIEEPFKAKIALIESETLIGQGFSGAAIDILNEWDKYFFTRAVEKETYTEDGAIKTRRVPENEIFDRFNSYVKLRTLLIRAYIQRGRISLGGNDGDNYDADDVYSELKRWIAGKNRYFGETSLAPVEYRFLLARALNETVRTMDVEKALDFPEILSDLKKRTTPTNALSHEVYLTYLSYLLRKEYHAKYSNTKIEYEKIIDKKFPKASMHKVNLKAVEYNSKLSKEKTKDLERDAKSVLDMKSLPKFHKTQILILNFLYDIAITEKRYSNAEGYLNQIAEIKKELCGEDSPEYHLALVDLASFFLDYTNKIEEAGNILESSFNQLARKEMDPQHPKMLDILNHLATYYEVTDDFNKASDALKQARDAALLKFTNQDILYAQELNEIAKLQLKLGEYEQAGDNLTEGIKVITMKKNSDLPEKRQIHISLLETQAKLFAIKGMFDEAQKSLDDSKNLIRKAEKKLDTQTTNQELASLLLMLGQYRRADELLNEQIPEYERLFGPNSIRLIEPLVNKSRVLLAGGEYSEAERVAQRAQRIAVRTYSENSTKTAPTQKMLADIYYTIGDYEKAEAQALKSIESQEKQFGRNHIEVAKSISQFALIKFHKGDNRAQVEKLMLEARDIVGQRLGKSNPQYADILKNVAVLYISERKFDIAFNSLTVAEEIWRSKAGSKNNINLASIYTLTGDVYYQTKNYKRAEEFYIKGKDLYEKFFSINHPEYVKIIAKLSKVYYMQKDYKKSKKYIEEALANYEKYIQILFPAFSEGQKAKYWNTMRGDFEFYNTLAFSNIDDFKDLSGKIYNYQLLTKALLLSSSIKMRERIQNSTDEDLKTQFNLWLHKKEQLTIALSMSSEQLAENMIDPALLQQEVERLEKDLSQRSELFVESFENKRITFEDVRKSLKPNEVAIEMVRYRHFNHVLTDSVVYAALYVTAEQNKPKAILMSDGRRMEGRFFKYYRNCIIGKIEDDISYGVYWKPIQDVLGRVSTIYLSADGIYNQINLEAIPTPDGRYIVDNSNIILVSNTKDLYLRKIKTRASSKENTASMVGNPTFYSSASGRKPISQLPGTANEVTQVTFMLKEKQWATVEYMENTASEENVKSVMNPKILHIATHGFYKPQPLTLEEELEANEAMLARNPLLRTGLLLRGAGDLLEKTQHNYNLESGVLTAYEAMSLNLDKTDLVVLSACETGLGDLQAGEGVYGLQRAFLVAGAKVLIMSMFKVDDAATQELMLKFYQKWLNSGNMRQSFIEAKKELRSTHPEPIYWGAFMMIGLE